MSKGPGATALGLFRATAQISKAMGLPLDTEYGCGMVEAPTTNDDLLDNLDNYDHLGMHDDDGIMYVEIELPDGSTARWARESPDGSLIDAITNAVESILGSPDTLMV